jgi:hypothetical protein
MTKREQLKRLIIEAIHGLPYEDAIKKEHGFPITIGRVIQAFKNKIELYKKSFVDEEYTGIIAIQRLEKGINKIIDIWNLTKKNGQECTDDDQSDETIDDLLSLFMQ